MKKIQILLILLIVSALSLLAQAVDYSKLSGPYLGQKPPGIIPELFAPGFISTEYGELNSVFNYDGTEFYFSRRGVPGKLSAIMFSRLVNGKWSEPEPVSFSGVRDDIDLFLLPDGNSIIFCSEDIQGNDQRRAPNHDFWISVRLGEKWSGPVPFAGNAVSEFEDYFPILTGNGNLYFNSQRAGAGTNDIYVSQFKNGDYSAAQKLPAPVNTKYREFDAFVSGDESLMIFSSDKPGGFGRSDLYVSWNNGNGVWSEPVNLGENINSEFSEYGATITPDGKYLFFTSNRNGSEDIFWVSAIVVEGLKPNR